MNISISINKIILTFLLFNKIYDKAQKATNPRPHGPTHENLIFNVFFSLNMLILFHTFGFSFDMLFLFLKALHKV